MDRFDRIYELNSILRTARAPVSRQRLEEELECSRATVKRIIEDMRRYLNAPIVYEPEYNGYRYDQTAGGMYELPGLWFNASELHALLTVQQLLAGVQPGLLDQHLKPLQKRIDDLLERQHLGSDGLADRVRILKMGSRQGGAPFMAVAGALARRQRLRIGYFNRGADSRSEREISPQRLNYYRDNWYLDAWCHLRDGLRTFALDAIESAIPLEISATRVPEADLERHFTLSYGIFSGIPDQVAVLRFSPERARWVAKEEWHRDQQGQFLSDGRYELHIPYSNPLELLMDVLKYGPDVEVVEPAVLRAEVQRQLREALTCYESVPETDTPHRPLLCLVVAVADNDVIGRGNTLPWHLPADLAHFRRLTLDRTIVMGRRTWESLPGPLPRRRILVLTRDPAFHADGCTPVRSLDAALAAATGEEQLMIVGGASLYAEALPRAERLYLTRVHAQIEGDTCFPSWDPAAWQEVSRTERPADERNPIPMTFVELHRIRSVDATNR